MQVLARGPGLLVRGALYALLWWVLTDGAAASWWIGAPAVVLALLASLFLLPPVSFAGYQALRFVPFFLVRSLLGGVDVARRAFQPRTAIAPDLVAYPLGLPAGFPRVFFLNMVSLLPGTLGAELEDDVLHVHVLDRRSAFEAELAALENRVAGIFGVTPWSGLGLDERDQAL